MHFTNLVDDFGNRFHDCVTNIDLIQPWNDLEFVRKRLAEAQRDGLVYDPTKGPYPVIIRYRDGSESTLYFTNTANAVTQFAKIGVELEESLCSLDMVEEFEKAIKLPVIQKKRRWWSLI